MVRRVYAGSPAYEQGLNAGDQIVAVDNMRVTTTSFNARSRRRSRATPVN